MSDIPPLRHYGGFIAAGLCALATDIFVLNLLSEMAGINLLIARLLSISVAMVVSFLINRTITFAMPGSPKLVEFLRFAAVAWMSSALNYAVFASVMLARPQTSPNIAVLLATATSMITSYLGMRLTVFRKG